MPRIEYHPAVNGWPKYPYVKYSVWDLLINSDKIESLQAECNGVIAEARLTRRKQEIREVLREMLDEEKK